MINELLQSSMQVGCPFFVRWHVVVTVHDAGESHLQEWQDRYLAPCPQPQEPHLDVIRAPHVREHLKRMKAYTARGADGWNVVELRTLPDPALEQLCLIYVACEAFSLWPAVFNEVYTTLLQKADDVDASGIRPIGVTCIPYRIWSSIRFQGLQEWSSSVLHPRQTAYRSGYCAQRLALLGPCRQRTLSSVGRDSHMCRLILPKHLTVCHMMSYSVSVATSGCHHKS